MDSMHSLDRSPHTSGIVIVFPPGVTSLFNSGVHRLVREVESRLDGVFVTYALSGGAVPDVAAALKAARFAGCISAVVVQSEDWLGDGDDFDSSTDTVWNETIVPAEFLNTAKRVVAAYNLALAQSGMAA